MSIIQSNRKVQAEDSGDSLQKGADIFAFHLRFKFSLEQKMEASHPF